MRFDTVLFDLDGTLTDPGVGICASIRYALEKTGLPAGPPESYHKWIGPPLQRSFEEYAGADPEQAKRLVDFYRERYSTVGLLENTVYPGIPALLRTLRARGMRLAVATGKPTVYARQILEHFGLLPCFDCVSGISLDAEPPDKCQVILHALRELGSDQPSRCVMVGDRCHDAIGARMAGVSFIGVLYGYGEREELAAEGARELAVDANTLGDLLLR